MGERAIKRFNEWSPGAAGGQGKDPGTLGQGLKIRPACCERTSVINTFPVSWHIRLFTKARCQHLITLAAPPTYTQSDFKTQKTVG